MIWQSLKTFLLSSWGLLKYALMNYLKGAAFKAVLEKLVKSLIKKVFVNAAFGGISGWFVSLFVKEILLEKAIEPLVKKAFLEIEYQYDVINGHIIIKNPLFILWLFM